jgi:hypothetical protein
MPHHYNDTERPGFDSQEGQGLFLSAIASRPALESTQLPIQWIPGNFPWGVKAAGA